MQSARVLLHHCDQKEDDLNHGQDMRCLANLDLHPVIHQVRGQFVRTLKSETDECAENHFPKALLLVSLQLVGAALLNE